MEVLKRFSPNLVERPFISGHTKSPKTDRVFDISVLSLRIATHRAKYHIGWLELYDEFSD